VVVGVFQIGGGSVSYRNRFLESLVALRDGISDTRQAGYWIPRYLVPHVARAISFDVGALELVGEFPERFSVPAVVNEPQWTPFCFVENLPNRASHALCNGEVIAPDPRLCVLVTKWDGWPATIAFATTNTRLLPMHVTVFVRATTGVHTVTYEIEALAREMNQCPVTRHGEGGALVDRNAFNWERLRATKLAEDNPAHTQGVHDGVMAMWAMSLVNARGVVRVESRGSRQANRRLCRILPKYEDKHIRLEPRPEIRQSVRESFAHTFGGIEMRYHFRRGNWAHFEDLKIPLRSGGMRSLGSRVVWRAPSFVGNPEKGKVHNDYRMEPK
jgi:hypothetical protein